VGYIREARVKKNLKRGILKVFGLCVRYYQRFVPKLAELSQPLTSLSRKERSVE
jgi:hypothetical protein